MRFITGLRVVLSIVVCASLAGAAGEVDTSFGGALLKPGTGRVQRTIVQPDGKIIVTGEFTAVGTTARKNIARLNLDGSVDTTFNPPVIVSQLGPGAGPAIFTVGLQSDGKVVLGGLFARGLMRLNADGSADTAFNSGSWLDAQIYVFDLKVYPDDRIVYAGIRSGYELTILNPDASLNRTSSFRAYQIALQTDGRIIAFDDNANTVRRFNEDLTLDNTFASVLVAGSFPPLINSMVIQPDGKILLGGGFTQVNGGAMLYISRINTNGTVDTGFNVGVGSPDAPVNAVAYVPGGGILIGGFFERVNGVFRRRLALLGAQGALDGQFVTPSGFTTVYDVDLHADGKILASSVLFPSVVPSPIVKLAFSGTIDPTFNGAVGNAGAGSKVVVLPDNKILVGGDFTFANGVARRSIARFNADGTLDTSFNQTATTANVVDFAVFPNGKVVIALPNINMLRLNTDGTNDITFGGPGIADAVEADPSGKTLVSRPNGTLQRLNVNGTVDSSFTGSVGVSTKVLKILRQPDGKVLIGGTFSQVNGAPRVRVARLLENGPTDLTFNTPGGANDIVSDIDLQADGKVIISGVFTSVSFTFLRGVARLNTDGTLDTGFSPVIDNTVEAVKVQPDGKILIGGLFTSVNSTPRSRYARLNTNGTLDPGFTGGTAVDGRINDIDQQSDGKIAMVGDFVTVNGNSALGVVRLLNPATPLRTQYDYDGDGRSDISVFRPSENKWYVLRSSDSAVTQQIFAIAGDIATPADFDGDDKTDLAIFRPSSGDWWSLSSANGTQVFAHWGGTGDIPRPSDFDGDGRADYVVFRPSDNFWYRLSSATGLSSNGAFGSPGDKPLIGDFDGDGKSDKAIYRPSTGDWWWQSSIDSVQHVVHWGDSTDIPAPADFDGDDKTDMAVYRPSIGTWYVLNSSNGSFVGLNFGLAEDKPVPADYDGDGRADIAVFRPSTGIWYLNRSTAGFTATQFGISSDIPTENAFVP